MKSITFALVAVLSLASENALGALAFEGQCTLFEDGNKTTVGEFSLDHIEGLQGKCPHTEFEFSYTDQRGEEKKLSFYAEHHGVYTHLSIFSKDISRPGSYASAANIAVGGKIHMGSSLRKGSSVNCTGELRQTDL